MRISDWSSDVCSSDLLKRLVNIVVASDSRSVRREDQLRELLHALLVKVESDNIASAPKNHNSPVAVRIYGDRATMVKVTAAEIQQQFKAYFHRQRTRIFHQDDVDSIRLTDETIFAVVYTLAPWRILGDQIDLLAKAFQIFRTQAMKSGEGQLLTPQRIIRPCVMATELNSSEQLIHPACGSGGFLIEPLRQLHGE